MCPTGWSVPADQGAEYQRDQRNRTYPLGELRRTLTVDVRIHDILTRAAAHRAARDAARPSATSSERSPSSTPAPTGPRTAWRREGVAPLDRVVWWGPTDLAALDVCYGVTKLGAALAPINPGFTEGEAATAHRVPAAARRGRASELRGAGAIDRRLRSACPSSSPRRVARRRVAARHCRRVGDSEDPSAIFLTSGSTGVAKAALLSHRATWLRAIAREPRTVRPDATAKW